MGLGRPRRLGDIAVQAAIEVHPAGLKGDRSEMVMVYLGESRAEVANDAVERVSGVKAGLSLKSRHSLCGLDRKHERMHDVLGLLIDTDQKTVPLSFDADRLAVDAQEPSPARPQLGRDLEWCLGLPAQFIDPVVERGATD